MDIFGRDAHDYSHLRALDDAGILNEQMQAVAAESGLPPHDFGAMTLGRAMGNGSITRAESNAQGVGYVTNNLQAVQGVIEEVLYTEFRLGEFIPMVTDVPEGAVTYAYRVVDRAGLGRFIDNEGKSAPSAQAGQRLVPYNLNYAGIVPKWTIEDVRRAMLGGIALDTETVTAGARGAMDHIEMVGLEGDSERGLRGLTNLTTGTGQVTLTSLTSLTWATRTAAQIRATIVGEIGAVISSTMEVFGRQIRSGLTVYLPTTQFNLVTSQLIGDNQDKTIWASLMGQNPWYAFTGQDPMVKSVIELDGAGASSTDRMIVAVNDRRVMEMAVPIMPRVITTLNEGYEICAPMEYKISGLNVKRPTTIRYTDGI